MNAFRPTSYWGLSSNETLWKLTVRLTMHPVKTLLMNGLPYSLVLIPSFFNGVLARFSSCYMTEYYGVLMRSPRSFSHGCGHFLPSSPFSHVCGHFFRRQRSSSDSSNLPVDTYSRLGSYRQPPASRLGALFSQEEISDRNSKLCRSVFAFAAAAVPGQRHSSALSLHCYRMMIF